MRDKQPNNAPDESRVDWGMPSDAKFPAKIKAWDEGYALGVKRSDRAIEAAVLTERQRIVGVIEGKAALNRLANVDDVIAAINERPDHEA